eukprot:GHVN01015725.1.p1 GENE.GHVN01015725.1~~GHVN01015725.1.p1  ORF type:complete len:485 (-),score=77.98 GHVN01015725.1:327-1781(-)
MSGNSPLPVEGRSPSASFTAVFSPGMRSPAPNVITEDPPLSDADPEMFELLREEKMRQRQGIELIASENFTSRAVMECLGSALTNKYSEGQIGARYYGGTQVIDKIEALTEKRVLAAFKLDEAEWGVNVQPYSGSPANLAAYMSILQPHDRIMGLDLPCGGHLTHGFYTAKKKVSATSIIFESLPYRTDSQGYIDYDELYKMAMIFRPKLIISGTSAYARTLDFGKFREICDACGARLMADISHISGLVATDLHPSPFPHCDLVTSTTHKTLRGPRAGMIIYNKKRIPDAVKKVNGAVFPSLQGGPHNHQIAAIGTQMKQVATPEFELYCHQVIANAKHLAIALNKKGPEYRFVTGGTDNHLLLWDLRPCGTSGRVMETVCDEVGISLNKNTVPGDASALSPSGVRIGTPGITTRGMTEEDMYLLADLLERAVNICIKVEGHGSKTLADITAAIEAERLDVEMLRADVQAMALRFPLPGQPTEI